MPQLLHTLQDLQGAAERDAAAVGWALIHRCLRLRFFRGRVEGLPWEPGGGSAGLGRGGGGGRVYLEEEEEEEEEKAGMASMKALEGPCPSEFERIISLAVVCLGGGLNASGGSGGRASCRGLGWACILRKSAAVLLTCDLVCVAAGATPIEKEKKSALLPLLPQLSHAVPHTLLYADVC